MTLVRTPSAARLALGLSLGVLAVACEEKKAGPSLNDPGHSGCELKLETLPGTEWVILKINPDKSEMADHGARLKFVTEDGKLKAKYNVQSVADMYTYRCEGKDDRVTCREKPRVKDFCQALVAGGKECSAAELKKILADATDKEIEDGIKAGMEIVNKYKDKPEWKQFVAQNNNLGNKLRGVIYAKLDSKRCQLRVTDNYLSMYNGKKVEDSNPVGTNPFVKNEMGELLWEHCENRTDFIPLNEGKYPADPANVGPQPKQTAGKEIHFWYLAGDAQVPVEGCTHKYDVWADGKPLAKGLIPKEADDGKGGKRLEWHYAHTFAKPSPNALGNVVQAVITSNCKEKKPVKKVACAAVLVQ